MEKAKINLVAVFARLETGFEELTSYDTSKSRPEPGGAATRFASNNRSLCLLRDFFAMILAVIFPGRFFLNIGMVPRALA
jgi:hypothetical protein